jgi:hypothetical protein
VERSQPWTIKDFEVVDGEEPCAGAQCSNGRRAIRQFP